MEQDVKATQAEQLQKEQNITTENNSPKSILTTIASETLGKNFKKIEINDFVDDSNKKIVLVHYRGLVGYDNPMTKKAMLIQTSDLFKKLFNAGIIIQEATAFIYTDMEGSKGISENLAMKYQLTGNTAASIRWSDINRTNFNQTFDYVWTAPGLRGD